MTFNNENIVGKTKELLEERHYNAPDWILDAEYHEWAIYAQRPYVAPLSNKEITTPDNP